ncbi:MAG: phosphomannomutase/phosphoglucomutase [bacterium]|nr:phosphomannomutase/phosphoglucomutase [bacterium]
MTGLHPDVFREYDIRGVVPGQLPPAGVKRLGMALGSLVRERGGRTVAVGQDNRFSSPGLAGVLAEGLTGAGCDVVDTGTVITPILYYADREYRTDAAVMVTASHNPPEFNGFKIVLEGAALHGDQIQDLRRRAGASLPAVAPGRVRRQDPVPGYLAMLKDGIRLPGRRLKVACDCGNGTAALFAVSVLESWGCDVVPLYCESDPRFPHHHPDPTQPANLRDLIEAVSGHRADLGIAFDGDGDRLGVVDNEGNVVWGDLLMCLYWREILPFRPGTPVLVEVKCSQALVDEVRRLGGEPLWTRTGHSLIKARMKELGAVFTGEMSGHMFFADEYFGFDDALYAAGRLLRLLAAAGRPLSELVADLPRYHATPEIRVDCPDDRKRAVVDAVTGHFAAAREVIAVDGARVIFPGGWGLVRASNTQPALVVRCEGETAGILEAIKAEVAAGLLAAGVERVAW